jgi:hypothetical protein
MGGQEACASTRRQRLFLEPQCLADALSTLLHGILGFANCLLGFVGRDSSLECKFRCVHAGERSKAPPSCKRQFQRRAFPERLPAFPEKKRRFPEKKRRFPEKKPGFPAWKSRFPAEKRRIPGKCLKRALQRPRRHRRPANIRRLDVLAKLPKLRYVEIKRRGEEPEE